MPECILIPLWLIIFCIGVGYILSIINIIRYDSDAKLTKFQSICATAAVIGFVVGTGIIVMLCLLTAIWVLSKIMELLPCIRVI